MPTFFWEIETGLTRGGDAKNNVKPAAEEAKKGQVSDEWLEPETRHAKHCGSSFLEKTDDDGDPSTNNKNDEEKNHLKIEARRCLVYDREERKNFNIHTVKIVAIML